MSKFPVIQADEGVTRQVLADHPDLMLVSFCFDKGAVGKQHNHPHVQSTFVKSGRFAFTMEGETIEMGPGDSLVIPSMAMHGGVCLEAGELVDCFTPRRDDFL